MKVKLWGTRGSIPSPGPETIRYGGNTSSAAALTLSDGSLLALDAERVGTCPAVSASHSATSRGD